MGNKWEMKMLAGINKLLKINKQNTNNPAQENMGNAQSIEAIK